jgi:hypothetical protein
MDLLTFTTATVCFVSIVYLFYFINKMNRPRLVFIIGAPGIPIDNMVKKYINNRRIPKRHIHISQNNYIIKKPLEVEPINSIDWKKFNRDINHLLEYQFLTVFVSGFTFENVEAIPDVNIHLIHDIPSVLGDEYITDEFSDTPPEEYFQIEGFTQSFNLESIKEMEYIVRQILIKNPKEPDEFEILIRKIFMPLHYDYIEDWNWDFPHWKKLYFDSPNVDNDLKFYYLLL